MKPYKQHRHLTRTDQYRSVTWLTRALLSTLTLAWLSLAAMPGWAAGVPDVRVLTNPFGSEMNSQCSSLGNLVTVTRAVQNFGDDLPAHQYYFYVSEITNTYTHGKDLDAHLHSKRYYLPAMPGQNRGKPVVFKMVVGTTASYVKKIPGPHALLVHLVENGVDMNTIGVLVDPVETVKFPPGFCQPVSRMSPSQMHMQATARMAPPKIRLISETYSVDQACTDPQRLITFRLRLQNNGGPLAAHKLEAWVEDDREVLPYNGVAHEQWMPSLMPGGTAEVTIPVGVLQRNIGQLPGTHSLAIGYYTSTALQNGTRPIARKHVNITLPAGICQPTLRMRSPAGMRMQQRRHLNSPPNPKLNPQPEPPSAVRRLSLPAVQ